MEELKTAAPEVTGPVGNTPVTYQLSFSKGRLVAALNYVSPAVNSDLTLAVDSDHVLDAIAAAIPGQVDDAIIAVIKAALKAVG